MWSVFLFARRLAWSYYEFMRNCAWENSVLKKCARPLLLFVAWFCFAIPCHATEGHASFASLLAGGLSPVGLGGYYSTPARYADPSYSLSYYWMDEVEESSWNLSLEFGSDTYRVGAFIAFLSMDSLYRNLYSEFSYARSWNRFVFGASYGLDMEWVPGGEFWSRHRFKLGLNYKWREIHLAALLSGFADEGVAPVLGVHWMADETISAFAECDFDYLYVGANFRWKFAEISTSYRFPNFAVAVQLSLNGGRYGASYARGFKHNSLGWNGVHVTRWLKDERRKIN